MFGRFLEAIGNAKKQGRLDTLERLTVRDEVVPGFEHDSDLTIEVLGPVPRLTTGPIDWPWFSGSSHTRNGHSLVLKLSYSEDGGDILYGMINCRTDGNQIVMAQMKERRTGADIWDSYEL